MTLSNKIRQHRLEANMTVEDLAIRVRIGSGLMQQIEEGLYQPDIQTLLKISTALDIPASEFLKEETIEAIENLDKGR